jgi:hypothetical protein
MSVVGHVTCEVCTFARKEICALRDYLEVGQNIIVCAPTQGTMLYNAGFGN